MPAGALKAAKAVYALSFATAFVMLFAGTAWADGAEIQRLIGAAGVYGPALIGLIFLATQVVAPLSGAPAVLVGFRLFGFERTLAVVYAVSLAGAVINFAIARRFGRPAVRRLIGPDALARADALSTRGEWTLLVASRLFGYYFFDVISYGIGLTRIPFGRYMAATAVVSLAPFAAQYALFRHADFAGPWAMVLYLGTLAATGALFAMYFFRRRPPRGPQLARAARQHGLRGWFGARAP